MSSVKFIMHKTCEQMFPISTTVYVDILLERGGIKMEFRL